METVIEQKSDIVDGSSLLEALQHGGVDLQRLEKMNLARSALRDTKTPTGNIALSLGYSDACAFSRAFSRAEGQSPLAYRNASH